MNVLLVEDDRVDALAVERAMTAVDARFNLHHVRSADAALDKLRSGAVSRPTVLVIDLHMPGKDGLALLRDVRADPGLTSLPAFMLSTSSDIGDRAAAAALHVVGWVTKTSDGARLRAFMQLLDLYRQVVTAP
ncbi:MAG: response regulator [Deltaproteobacteria bacterium]|nr:response regulator [Deltaproteobacteria bacterium]MCB9788577.1 response regulator [Deltaproteobacteria bacterium]